ncbi:hypothetical protein D1839_15430 [Roseburia sp. 1XD42-34]|nr:hypothetical protein [Roseburia sp. 1XD42-34]RKI75716.1 hypothetical protein D7V87_15515 [Clostridium sp. 1xD42-85]
MINYRKILELYFEDVSQGTISSSTGHSSSSLTPSHYMWIASLTLCIILNYTLSVQIHLGAYEM